MSTLSTLPARDGYRLWARQYDAETAVSRLEDLAVAELGVETAGRTLLDAGCGTGRRLRETRAALAVGVDLTVEMLAAGRDVVGRSSGTCHVAGADVAALPFPSESFDVAWCRLVIGHVRDIEPVYRELGRVCRRGGMVVVSDIAPEAVAAGHRRTFTDDAGTLHELEHFVRTADAHAAAAASAGLELVSERAGVVGESIRDFYMAAGRRSVREATRTAARPRVRVARRREGAMTVLQPRPMPTPAGRALAALPRQDPITNLPILILFPHSRCNCRCLMCDIWRGSEKREIDPAHVAHWVHEWRQLGVRRVVLSGGEALMHSRLWELCDVLRAAEIDITVLSTGLLLRRDAIQLARRCDEVVVSLDGPQPIHDRIRNVPRAYERLADGVAAVREADARVAVSGRCTVQRANHATLRDTVAAAHDIGLDRISFLAADVSSDAFNRPGGWDASRTDDVALSADEVPALAAEIDALERERAEDFATGFIAESPDKLRRRLAQYFAALRGSGDFHPNQCNAPWVSTVIETDGTVRPCFFQPPLGNLHHASSLGAILNSADAIAWRQGLNVERDAICRRCVCTLALASEDTR